MLYANAKVSEIREFSNRFGPENHLTFPGHLQRLFAKFAKTFARLQCLESYPDLRACSFDRGFHSPENRVRLDGLLGTAALPKKGKLNAAERARETAPAFARARRRHPAVESAINNLEQRGLDRVRSKGADGFERTVGLSILAANLHRIGLLLQRRERRRADLLRTQRRKAA